MSTELEQLRSIINDALGTITAVCNRRQKTFPSLDSPADPSEHLPSGIRNDPEILEAVNLGVAAAAQLIATLQSPSITVITAAFRHTLPSCLRVAETLHVPEILREADPQGLHVKDIAERCNTDAGKLAQVMRYLATNHFFREVAPDVFTHNLLSSLLDTGKSLEEIKKDPASKFDNTNGSLALLSFSGDEGIKSTAYLAETLTDPKFAFSQEINEASYQKAFNTTYSMWEYPEQTGNMLSTKRFASAMVGMSKQQPPQSVVTGYDWSSVPKGAVFVDVGGGVGQVTVEVAKARPDLRCIILDRPATVEKAKAYLESVSPDLLSSGSISLIGSSFFDPIPQLPSTPDVYLLRFVMHNWSDKYCAQILKNLRQASKPETKLLIIDSLLGYACPIPDDFSVKIPGYEPPKAPAPLLANLGYSSVPVYDVDLAMLYYLNAKGRTIGAFHDLLLGCGWRLSAVRTNPGNKWPMLVAEPL